MTRSSQKLSHSRCNFAQTAAPSSSREMAFSAIICHCHANPRDDIGTLWSPAYKMRGIQTFFFCSVSGNFAWQERQQPNANTGPRCHLSSFRLREMDVLHFAAHNIGRGNQSTPQRASVAVLKLSIVSASTSVALFWGGRTYQGPHSWKGWGVVAASQAVILQGGCCLEDKVSEPDQMAVTW